MTDVFTQYPALIGQLQSRAQARETPILQLTRPVPEQLWLGSFHAILWDGVDWEEFIVHAEQNQVAVNVTRHGSFLFEAGTKLYRKTIPCAEYPEEAPNYDYPTSRALPQDNAYFHREDLESALWVVKHGLGKLPGATCRENVGIEAHATVSYIDPGTLQVQYEAPTKGYAYVK